MAAGWISSQPTFPQEIWWQAKQHSERWFHRPFAVTSFNHLLHDIKKDVKSYKLLRDLLPELTQTDCSLF